MKNSTKDKIIRYKTVDKPIDIEHLYYIEYMVGR